MVAKRVLIAEAHPMCAAALSGVVQGLEGTVLVAQVCSLEQLRRALTENHIDLITLDLELHDSQGLLTVAAVREIAPKIPILVITSASGNDLKKQLQKFGIKGFISKMAQMGEVGEAISAVLKGETWLSSEIKSGELDEAASRIGRLSGAQIRILLEMSDGHSNKEIAFRLGLAEQTVKTHASAIFRNLGVTNRSQAILMVRDDAKIR